LRLPALVYADVLTLESVRKSYHKGRDAVPAVDGLSFSVGGGEILGLLGPNGAGKSTTVNLVVGLLAPDAGTVCVQTSHASGRPLDPAVRRAIGVAPQALALYDLLSGEENVRFMGELYGLTGARLDDAVTRALEFVGLSDRRRARTATYSGGMKRRLNLAAALVHDPDIILLDEPTVGVDPQSRNQIFDGILALKRLGRAIVYTTHYMEEAERLCDRVAVIDRGRLLALGAVDELLEAYGAPPRTVVQRGTLEEVFLNLTGRSLRD
jgi:ABC-2 type transport system ATP-binding protein